MTIHDRILAVYNNQLPDRFPIGIYERYLPRGVSEREARNHGLGIIRYFPLVSMPGPPWHLYPGFLSEIKGTDISVDYAWDRETLVERRTYKTPVGEVSQEVSQDKAGIGSEHIRKYYIAEKDDYRVMKYIIDNTVIRSNEETIQSLMQDLGDDGIVLGRIDRNPYQKCLIELVGAEKFLVDLYTDPEPALELMESLDKKLDESFDMLLDSGVEAFWQPDNVTSDMTPPSQFETYCLPFYTKHSAQVKQTGKPYIVHMDGKIKALTDLINQSGFDAIESLSFPEIGGDFTLTEARKAFPDKVIIPNFPSNWCTRNSAELEQSLRELYSEAGTEKPFMLQISEDIPVDQWQRVIPLFARTVDKLQEG